MNEDISTRLSSLLSDPQALGQIMSLVSGMMGTNQKLTEAQESGFTEPSSRESDRLPPSLSDSFESSEPIFARQNQPSPPIPPLSLGGDHRCELLKALKPYMRNERAGKIDLMIRVLQLSSVMKSSGIGLFDRR